MHSLALVNHAALITVANAFAGGGKTNGPPPPPGKDPNRTDLAAGATDVNAAVANINAMLRGGL